MVQRTSGMFTSAAGESAKALALLKEKMPPAACLGAARAVIELGIKPRQGATRLGPARVPLSADCLAMPAQAPRKICPFSQAADRNGGRSPATARRPNNPGPGFDAAPAAPP